MNGIYKLCLCLGGGTMLASCAAGIPLILNANKDSIEQKVGLETKSVESVVSKEGRGEQSGEILRNNWENEDVQWRPVCGISPLSLCLIPWD